MPGEQLPPIIATLEGDDSDFLAMLDRDVAALRAAAGEIDGLLAGLDLGAALADSMRGANLGAINVDELTQGLSEGLAGVGDALGQDVGSQLTDAVRGEGVQAGAALAEGVAEGASGAGDSIGQDLTAGLVAEASNAGARAGESLSESLTGAVSGVGQDVATQVDAGLGALPGHFAAVGASAGHAMTASLEASLLGLAGAAASAAGALGGIGAAIEVRLADVLMQAGQAAGGSLVAGISDGASGGARTTAAAVGRALEASLTDALTESGAPAGDALLAGIQDGVRSSADSTAVKISESLQPPLESQMTALGQLAGDAFNAGLGESAGGAGDAGGGGLVQEFRQQAAEVEQEAENLGQNLVRRIQAGGTYSAGGQQIPYGGVLSPDELLNMGQQPDQFVPNFAGGQNSWILASKTGAKQAADAAWAAYGDELAGLVIPPERFLALTDAGVQAWTEEVAAQAAASGDGFVHAFADAMTMGMAGIDYSALSDAQARALGQAMRGTLTEAMAEAEPEAQAAAEELGISVVEALQAQVTSTGSDIADALIAQIVEAKQAAIDQVVALSTAMAEQGAEAGGKFSQFFSDAWDGLKAPFAQDPAWLAAQAERAGTEAADAMVASIEQGLGVLPEAAGAEGAEAGSRFAAFFSQAWNGVKLPFAADPAQFSESGTAAGVEFANAFTVELQARLAEIGAAGGPEFAALVEQQLATQLDLAAAQATEAYEQQLAEGLAQAEMQAVLGLDSTEGQLDAVFASIWQHGQLMSSQLAGAMTNALAGIEADTSGFTAEELAQWDTFFTTLEERGAAAAQQLAITMGSLQGKDLVGQGLTTVGNPMASLGNAGSEAEGLATGLGGVEKAAAGATEGIGGMASAMGGPWMMAAMMAIGFVPQIASAFTSSAASAADFTQAVQQDSNAVGDNTAATIQQTLAKSGLDGISQQLGVSQATLIEYAAGESQAQQAVTQAYQQKQDALNSASNSEGVHSKAENDAGNAADREANALANKKMTLDQVTDAVQQAVQQDADNSAALLEAEQSTKIYTAAVNALGQSQLLQVQQTKMQNQATAEFGSQVLFAESSVSYMTAAMGASEASMQQSALTSAYASVGLLNLGTSQTELNAQLAAGETQYSEATSAAGAYNTLLTSMSGAFNTLYGAEASFTGALESFTRSVDQNGRSLDANSAKGYQNAQAAEAVANAAQHAAEAVFENDVANGRASQAYQDANAKLEQEKEAFIQAAEKAGFHKQQVQQLADELYQLPASINTKITVNDSQAESAINHVLDLYTLLNAQGANAVQEEVTAIKLGATHRASGGPVEAGRLYDVNENGQEGFFIPPASGYIVPHDQMAALGPASGGGGSPSWVGSGGGVTQAPPINVTVLLNSREITAEVRADAQEYATHNTQTGFESRWG